MSTSILLIVPPGAGVERPSLGLETLQAALTSKCTQAAWRRRSDHH